MTKKKRWSRKSAPRKAVKRPIVKAVPQAAQAGQAATSETHLANYDLD